MSPETQFDAFSIGPRCLSSSEAKLPPSAFWYRPCIHGGGGSTLKVFINHFLNFTKTFLFILALARSFLFQKKNKKPHKEKNTLNFHPQLFDFLTGLESEQKSGWHSRAISKRWKKCKEFEEQQNSKASNWDQSLIVLGVYVQNNTLSVSSFQGRDQVWGGKGSTTVSHFIAGAVMHREIKWHA